MTGLRFRFVTKLGDGHLVVDHSGVSAIPLAFLSRAAVTPPGNAKGWLGVNTATTLRFIRRFFQASASESTIGRERLAAEDGFKRGEGVNVEQSDRRGHRRRGKGGTRR